MCLAQGPQRSDAGEARTPDPSVSSQALYHLSHCAPFDAKKISSVACGFSPIKIHFSDYTKSLIGRIHEVYVVVFSIKYCFLIHEVYVFFIYTKVIFFLKKNPINFIYNRLFCCNHTCYCVGMVSVTSGSLYVASASHYQSRS